MPSPTPISGRFQATEALLVRPRQLADPADEGGRHDPRDEAVAQAFQPTHQRLEVGRLHAHDHAGGVQQVEQATYLVGQVDREGGGVLTGGHQLPEERLRREPVQDELAGVRSEELAEVELGVQSNSHALHHQEEPQQRGHLLRKLQAVLPQQREQLGRQLGDVDLTEASTAVEAHEDDQVGPELLPVHRPLHHREVQQRLRQPLHVVAGERGQDRGQLVAEPVVDLPHHPEVDQPDPTVRLDEQVPRMGIGVEEAVLEDHADRDSGGLRRQGPAVDPGAVEAVEVVHLDPDRRAPGSAPERSSSPSTPGGCGRRRSRRSWSRSAPRSVPRSGSRARDGSTPRTPRPDRAGCSSRRPPTVGWPGSPGSAGCPDRSR